MERTVKIELVDLPPHMNMFEVSNLIKRALYTEKKFDGKVLDINVTIPKEATLDDVLKDVKLDGLG